ncbi:MAG TPA: MFS transporter, partial [Jatrophihabitans sp.]|nr:MFS transporter [Jatrophihabitans sp.]
MHDAGLSAWRPVLAYAGLSAANQMLWLTYAPITTGAAHHYGVSESAIGWLAELFPLLYVVLAVPTGRLIDANLRRWLTVGAVLTGLGALVRVLGDDYWVALGGQLLVAVAQPLVLNAVIAVSAAYLAERDRARGIAVS